MIDASTELPEAMVTVGPASYIVRAGDQIGSWRVTGVSPNGIWINAGLTERVWRPLLTPAATHRNLSGVVPGAPATPAPALPAWEAERPSNDQARGAPK